MKGFAERRMHAISESLNTKLDREVKNVLTKQNSTENQQNQNFQIASDQFQTYKKYSTNQLTQLSELVAQIDHRQNEVQLKVNAFMRTVDQIKGQQEIRNGLVGQSNQITSGDA